MTKDITPKLCPQLAKPLRYFCANSCNSDTFGFLLQTATVPSGIARDAIVNAIRAWASRDDGLVEVLSRPNDYIDLAAIGAGQMKRDVLHIEARSRGNGCPADIDILQYATEDVPDLDLNNQIRWAEVCEA